MNPATISTAARERTGLSEPIRRAQTADMRIPLVISLLLLTAVALFFRVGYLDKVGHISDVGWNILRSEAVVRNGGWLALYASTPNTDYPPLFLGFLGVVGVLQTLRGLPILSPATGFPVPFDATLVVMLKTLPVLAELGTIWVSHLWLRYRRWLRWLIPLGLALSPGLIMDASWWGQSDSVMTLLLVLSVLALVQGKARLAWVFWALAILTKFQSVALLPILLVVTFVRYGVRKTAICLAIALLIGVVTLAPFVAVSGWSKTTYPYFGVVGQYPYITVNSVNGWYFFSVKDPLRPSETLNFPEERALDSTPLLGPITIRLFGLFILGWYVVVLLMAVYRQRLLSREFVWAAAIYFAFFNLPTQVHERYLYPGLVFLCLAIAQDRRVWPIVILTSYAFGYNIILSMDNSQWASAAFFQRDFARPVAALMVLMFVLVTRYLLTLPRHGPDAPVEQPSARPIPAWRFTTGRVIDIAAYGTAALLILIIAAQVVTFAVTYYPVAGFLNGRVADYTHLATDDLHVVRFTRDLDTSNENWVWTPTGRVDGVEPGKWLDAGIHYLVMSASSAPSTPFAARVASMQHSGARLVYQDPNFAVFQPFRPQVEAQTTFDGAIQFFGYTNLPAQPRQMILHWVAERVPTVQYQYFLHVVDQKTGQIIAQQDGPVGGDHVTNTWRLHEIIFQTITIPDVPPGATVEYHFGLYQLASGDRAAFSSTDPLPKNPTERWIALDPAGGVAR